MIECNRVCVDTRHWWATYTSTRHWLATYTSTSLLCSACKK